jgi:hypothetical protein
MGQATPEGGKQPRRKLNNCNDVQRAGRLVALHIGSRVVPTRKGRRA